MSAFPWWVTVPAVLAFAVVAGLAVLAAWIRGNGPVVQARWHTAVQAEKAQRRELEEVPR